MMQGYPHWRIRRAIIFSTLIFCAGCILYVMVFSEDTRVAETIAMSAFGLGGAVIASYVFGAVWEDNATRSAGAWETAPALGEPPGRPFYPGSDG